MNQFPNHEKASTRQSIGTAFSLLIVFFALLHLYGGLNPTPLDWGFHQFGFLPLPVFIATFLLMLVFALPVVQDAALRLFERAGGWQVLRSRMVWTIILILASAAIFWIGRERLLLYGDSRIVSLLAKDVSFEDLARYYKYEPFAGMVESGISSLLSAMNVEKESIFGLQLISVLCGIGSLFVLLRLSRSLVEEATGRGLLVLFVFAGGGTLLFFGHVENYPPLYLVLLLFLMFGVEYLNGRGRLVFPFLAFGVLFALHFGAVVFLPSLLYLFFIAATRKAFAEMVIAPLVLVVGCSSLLIMAGYTPDLLVARFGGGGRHLVALFGAGTGWQAYSLFSLYHILDLINLGVMLSALAPCMLLPLAGRRTMQGLRREAVFQFIVIAALGGIALVCVMNSDPGLSVDWDLMSSFYLPLTILAVLVWIRSSIDQRTKHRLLLAMGVVTVLHTSGFVLLNVNRERALTRYTSLADTRLWSAYAYLQSYEQLARFYDDRGDLARAEEYYDRYVKMDSLNERILSNIADLYQRMGDTAKMVAYLERSIACGTKHAVNYFVLAEEYKRQRRFEDAARLEMKGLMYDSTSFEANLDAGVYLTMVRKSYGEGLGYLSRAAELDVNSAAAYYYTGICYALLHQDSLRDAAWHRFLQLDSTSEFAERVRGIMGQRSNEQ